MSEILVPRALPREDVRAAIVTACVLGDATLDSYIDELWAAKTDADLVRRLLARFRLEVDAARSLLAAAGEPQWWQALTTDRLEAACRAVRIWAGGDPICAELEGPFASHLRRFSGIDIAHLPRRPSTP